MTALDPRFLGRPIAHRALHGAGRPENSLEAIEAACRSGFGIEIDLQLSADGEAMVFHDYDLGRLTAESGAIRQRTSADLRNIQLSGGASGIPTLPEVLAVIKGRVPLLIEQLREAEVEQLQRAALQRIGGRVSRVLTQEDVRGLEVAVHDPARVRSLERAQELEEDDLHLTRRRRRAGPAPVARGSATGRTP